MTTNEQIGQEIEKIPYQIRESIDNVVNQALPVDDQYSELSDCYEDKNYWNREQLRNNLLYGAMLCNTFYQAFFEGTNTLDPFKSN